MTDEQQIEDRAYGLALTTIAKALGLVVAGVPMTKDIQEHVDGLLAARERAVWLEAAKLAEDLFDHRKYPVEFRRGDFNMDYESAGDCIAAECRKRAEMDQANGTLAPVKTMTINVGDWVRYRIPNFRDGEERIERVSKVETLCVLIGARGYWMLKDDILEVRQAGQAQAKERR